MFKALKKDTNSFIFTPFLSSLAFCIDKTFNYIVKHSDPADNNEVNLSKVCKAYDTPYVTSTYVYDYIKEHIADWIEEAIEIRNSYPK